MSPRIIATLALASLVLTGCGGRPVGIDPLVQHGRYAGVGLYGPSRQWTRLVAAERSKDPQAAHRIDDQILIVVQDTATGEVRACGDLTGYCIGMNPWKTALLTSQVTPIRLTEHATDNDPALVSLKADAPATASEDGGKPESR